MTVRLAYRGRSGARWTYASTLISAKPGALEVRMLVPLALGLPVEIETPLAGGAQVPRPSENVRARVTGCRCKADGLFQVRLELDSPA